MVEILKIATLGDEVLLKEAKSVIDARDSDIQELVNQMIATLNKSGGVGLAAPQVFESKEIIIVHSFKTPNYPDAPDFGPETMINPKITKRLEETEKSWEGCLSVPGYRGLVPRYKEIKVEYTDKEGKKKIFEAKDFIARIIQHETDHLKGILYLQRLERMEDLVTIENYQRIANQE